MSNQHNNEGRDEVSPVQFALVAQNVIAILAAVEEIKERLDGCGDKAGLILEVDRLKQARANTMLHAKMIWPPIIALIGKAIYDLFASNGPRAH